MFDAYQAWVQAQPFQSAAIQFAILGTLGEVIAATVRQRRVTLPCTPARLALKALAWALLGLIIKYGFIGMRGFTELLLDKGMLPGFLAQENSRLGFAFALSTLTNVFFGPQMMAFHRIEDNLILGEKGFKGIQRAWWTLVWFWIPAHTVTFALPQDYQIGLAAVWGLVLGIILGLAKPKS